MKLKDAQNDRNIDRFAMQKGDIEVVDDENLTDLEKMLVELINKGIDINDKESVKKYLAELEDENIE